MNQEVGATEGGRDWGAIIPSFLDDYGLDPYEMRVYIRLARRAGMGGQCWESISKMASDCRMSDRKLKDCLALLIAANLIKQLKRSGFTDVYELLPESHWVPPIQLDSLRSCVTPSRRHSNNKRQNTPEPEIAKQGRYVAPGYIAPGYIAPGYVTPGCVAPGYVAPTPQVLSTSVGRYSVPTPQVLSTSVGRYSVPTPQAPGTSVERYAVPGGQAPGTYKGIPLRNPLEDFPEDIPNTPLTPQSEKPRVCDYPARKNSGLEKTFPTSVPDNTGEIKAKTVSVEVVCSAAPAPETQKKNSAAGENLLDEKLSQLLERYNRGEIGKLPEPELKMLAATVIGDTVQMYRRSGKVLSSAPNDIDRQLMQFIAIRDQQDFVYGTRLIAAMERTPSRWGELVELVAAWQLGDVHAIPTAAKQIALHSRLQQSKQSTFEAIKDL